jgi:hypothetical protein
MLTLAEFLFPSRSHESTAAFRALRVPEAIRQGVSRTLRYCVETGEIAKESLRMKEHAIGIAGGGTISLMLATSWRWQAST